MTRNDLTPEQWLDLLIRKAPALRSAGVTTIDLVGCRFEISPEMPQLEQSDQGQQEHTLEPLDDPATYGRLGRVPGYPPFGDGWPEGSQ